MKKLSLCLVLFALWPLSVNSWGFFAHKTINYAAVFTLPEEMFPFYRNHIELIRSYAVNADKRRYVSEHEARYHYLDADVYEQKVPIDTIPKRWKDALEKYGLDSLNKHGIGPWHLNLVHHQLTKAFNQRNFDAIVRLSADLGHYVGDLHVPLHTTKNYNGQLSDQHGIHGFWESRLPELFVSDYDLFTGKARYIDSVQAVIWQRFEESFAAKDSVLLFEARLSSKTSDEKKYGFEPRGASVVKTYSRRYSEQYHVLLNDMVERRLRASIELTGSLWYTAWVNAGQPVLEMDYIVPTDSTHQQLDSAYRLKNIIGRMEAK
ncbi:MAG: S1/P1 Nuclease [Bacteroidia bacterium]|nr:S1/P1 Nuclease [Bacteroidia bacterium]